MSVPVPWPGDLPPAPQRSSGGEVADGRVAFQPDHGRAKVRRAVTAPVQRLDLVVRVNQAQYARLMTFLSVDLAGMTGVFAWVHPVTVVPVTYAIRAGEAPRWSVTPDGRYDVTLPVEVIA